MEKFENLNKEQKQLVESLLMAMENGKNVSHIEETLNILNKESELKEPLKKALNEVGESPLQEKEIYKISKKLIKLKTEEEIAEVELEAVEHIFDMEELDKLVSEGCTLKDMLEFAREAIDKVTSFYKTTEDGQEVFKEIESQNNLEPIKSFQVMKKITDYDKKAKELGRKAKIKSIEFMSKGTEYDEKIRNGELSTKEYKKLLDKHREEFEIELSKMKDNIEQFKTQSQAYCFEHCNLEVENMSQWEKDLLWHKMKAMAAGDYTPPMGKL